MDYLVGGFKILDDYASVRGDNLPSFLPDDFAANEIRKKGCFDFSSIAERNLTLNVAEKGCGRERLNSF